MRTSCATGFYYGVPGMACIQLELNQPRMESTAEA